MEHVDTESLVRSLLQHGDEIPDFLHSDIIARGSEAVGPLLTLLGDPSLDVVTAPGQGFAPVHATRLLAELGASEAIVPMLQALARTDPGYVLHEELLDGLERYGPAVAPPALELLAQAESPDYRERLLAVLAHCGVKDERIYEALCEQLRTGNAELVAMYLADYGDPRAIEPLKQAFDAHELEAPEGMFSNQTLLELDAVIRELGGSLEPAQAEKLAQVMAHREQWRAQFLRARSGSRPVRRQARPGRNEPCWCGSGVKYKKCHLSTDPR